MATTPRDLINTFQSLPDGQTLGATAAASLLKGATSLITLGFIAPDEWNVGGALITEDGERRLRGIHADYLVASIEVTGRKVRYDHWHLGGAIRVRVEFESGDDTPNAVTGAWMEV